MAHRHLNSEELLRALYLGEEMDCSECATELAGLKAERRTDIDLPEAFWTRQRAEILGTLRTARRRRWIAAVAMAVVMVIAFFATRPAPQVAVSHGISAKDEQLLNDVNDSVTRIAPSALTPMDPFLGGGQ